MRFGLAMKASTAATISPKPAMRLAVWASDLWLATKDRPYLRERDNSVSLRISFQVQRVDQDSVHRDMRLLDDIAPGQRLLLDESGRLSRGAAAGFEVEVVEVRLDLGLLQHLADRLVKLVDDGLGRAGRRADGVPGPRLEVFHADFGKGRDVLERR